MRVKIDFKVGESFTKQKADAIKETNKFVVVSVGSEEFWHPIEEITAIRVKN